MFIVSWSMENSWDYTSVAKQDLVSKKEGRKAELTDYCSLQRTAPPGEQSVETQTPELRNKICETGEEITGRTDGYLCCEISLEPSLFSLGSNNVKLQLSAPETPLCCSSALSTPFDMCLQVLGLMGLLKQLLPSLLHNCWCNNRKRNIYTSN